MTRAVAAWQRCAVVFCLAFAAPVVVAQGGSPPAKPSRLDPRAIEQDVALWRKGDEAARRKVLVKFARSGPIVRDHLAAAAAKEGALADLADLVTELDRLSGRDLERKAMPERPAAFSLWTAPAGEVLVFRAEGGWAGVIVDPKLDPKAKTLPVTILTTKDKLLPLGGPGVEKSVLDVAGVPVPLGPGKSPAYPPMDHAVSILGRNVVLRRLGTTAIRVGVEDAGLTVARSGRSDPASVKAGDPSLVYKGAPDSGLFGDLRRIQQYVFRLVPGIAPLPTYDTADEERYAEAEHVRVDAREDLRGELVIHLAFPHLDDVAFGADEAELVRAFAVRVLGRNDVVVLVARGNQELHELNAYFDGKGFGKPKPELVARLRRLFPEDG